ncbi:beta-1,3-glucanase family protein [Nocardioides sp. C4-1]|uniref:beta-1,3-glucanase family protein n=1 Tax=Nocardioides sp. C4-1 TaxID=3151851 RepID=UPI0032638D00
MTRPTGLSRRSLLLRSAGVAGVGLTAPLWRPPAASAAGPLPLTVLNRSGRFADDGVFVHVVGTELATGRQGHVDAVGAFVPASLADNGPDGTAPYGIPLSQRRTVGLPEMSARVYVSLGAPIPFRVVGTPGGAGIVHPAGWVASDPSYGLLYDMMEFTHQSGAMYCNTTMVDMYSLPLSILLRGQREQRVGETVSGGRARFFDAISSQPGFDRLVVGDTRVVAPSHGIGAGTFDAGYLDDYIASSWSAYTGSDLTVVAGPQTYRCRVEGGRMTAYQGSEVKASFAQPSTSDVLFCNGAITAPNDGVGGPVAAILGAALNRTTLRDVATQPSTDPGRFYREERTNHYARVLHEIHTDGLAYGFAFDDVAGFASYIQDPAAREVELSIDPL